MLSFPIFAVCKSNLLNNYIPPPSRFQYFLLNVYIGENNFEQIDVIFARYMCKIYRNAKVPAK